ncbi:procyclin-associated gene, putative [Trypanosoma brucei gambiense DAL972]|uniref:Procyclin-associated gene, putative n=1 Tax=Trypanosoma brucei gambiense (strain MHOM/CI/86/DAL972) TaxID=679716 RepID=D0A4F8_TRYB9|nr:procyclin-associated gene, putative [Trypanosoma brucei gambiense DAL972]CBH16152.1 procyclin-associated gene, putative [Trypanosoma brucei gambiense DAL972]|eukprot:XP_011778416.1 procyclin-associated gene, putative [Trypanosoma brucei gambiense DAL972]
MVSLIILFRLTFAIANRVRTLMKVLVIVSFFVLTGSASADSGALSLSGAAEALCNASKRLKSVYAFVQAKTKYATEKVREFEDMVELVRLKIVRVRGNEGGNGNWTSCTGIAKFLKRVGSKVNRVKRRELKRLRYLGYSAVGAAGIAAGRLDEFVSVFQQPNNRNGVEFFSCAAGARGEAATKAELHDCFQGGKTAVDAAEFLSVEDVEEKKGSQAEGRANLEEAIRRHLKPSNNDPRYTGGESQGCQLVRGSSGGGYLGNASLTTNLLWGDGIFGVKKDGVGETAYIGDTRNETYSYDMMWEENPTTNVPTLRAAMDAYRAFEEQVSEYGDIYRSLTEEWTEKTIGRRADAMKILNGLGSLPIENVSALNSRTKQDWLSASQVKDADKDLLMTEIGLCGGLGRRSFFRRMFRKAWRKIFGGNWGKDD